MLALVEACALAEIGDLRVHGNGFIQMDLPDGRRLDIWGHPDIPRQASATPIHDHSFGFTSECLVGQIVNVEYHLSASRIAPWDYEVLAPVTRHGADTVLERTHETGILRVQSAEVVLEGESYEMYPWVLHGTFVNEPTATVITREKSDEERQVRVLLRRGREPDNRFTRYDVDPARLLAIVREVLS